MCTQWYDEGNRAMSQPVEGEERPFTSVLKSARPHTHTFTEGDLTGAVLILSRQAQVRCLHPGIKLKKKKRFPPIAPVQLSCSEGWKEAERHLSAQSMCRAVILKWMKGGKPNPTAEIPQTGNYFWSKDWFDFVSNAMSNHVRREQ